MKKIILTITLLTISSLTFASGTIDRGQNSLTINMGFAYNPAYYVQGCITPDHGVTSYCVNKGIDGVGNSFFRFYNPNIPGEMKAEFYITKDGGSPIYQDPAYFHYNRGAQITKSGAKFMYGQVPFIYRPDANQLAVNFGYYGLSLITGEESLQNHPEWIDRPVLYIPEGYSFIAINGYFSNNTTTFYSVPSGKCGFIQVVPNNLQPGWDYFLFGGYGVKWDLYSGLTANYDNSMVCF